jgi:cytochrome P450
MANSGFARIGKHIFGYMTKRRLLNKPVVKQLSRLVGRDDSDEILTELALAKFPDGSPPSLVDVTGLGAFLFGAGQDTTNRLLSNGFRIIAERPDIQAELRADAKRIPAFLEELLRFEGSVKSGGRMCVKTTTVGGVEIKAGTTLLLSHMAANRDPKRFENPHEFNMDRPRAKEHLAFGRGAHTCIGAPLARKEVTVSIERLLARMGNIRLSEAHHGPEGHRRFDYEPTYILRALKSLHLEFDPL